MTIAMTPEQRKLRDEYYIMATEQLCRIADQHLGPHRLGPKPAKTDWLEWIGEVEARVWCWLDADRSRWEKFYAVYQALFGSTALSLDPRTSIETEAFRRGTMVNQRAMIIAFLIAFPLNPPQCKHKRINPPESKEPLLAGMYPAICADCGAALLCVVEWRARTKYPERRP